METKEFEFRLFLCSKSNVCKVFPRLCGYARRFGTMDELFEAMTLIQTKKIARFHNTSRNQLLVRIDDWIKQY
jgi:hypothetical protein